jgi:farnesyl diphosphate synthase
MSNIEKALNDVSSQLYEYMDQILPSPSEGNKCNRLFEAMRYSTLSQGKRLRPFLTVTCADLFGVSRQSSLQVAAAIEFIHAYSLIHDDLPAMDDDIVRRGQPCCHIQFDEATAILAGDALLTLAFETLAADSTNSNHAVRIELIKAIAKTSGCDGLVGGQYIDISTEHQSLEINEIIHLQRLKTGVLFGVSCEAGAILGRGARNLRLMLRGYAHDLGAAFQIVDDLLDAEGSERQVGKKLRKDQAQGKSTIVSCIGVEKAHEQAKFLAQQAQSYLEVFGSRAELLGDLVPYVLERKR